jgi:antirestriction protein ArdC
MSKHEHSSSAQPNVYEAVTSQIVNAIEQGVGSWRMPWHTSGRYSFSPINVISRKAYRGINTVCLWAAADAKGYESGEWGTYKQWQERSAQVRKGEKSTTVVFWKFAGDAQQTQEDGDEHSTSGSHLLFVRAYSVFNAQQVDGYSARSNRKQHCWTVSRTRKRSSKA